MPVAILTVFPSAASSEPFPSSHRRFATLGEPHEYLPALGPRAPAAVQAVIAPFPEKPENRHGPRRNPDRALGRGSIAFGHRTPHFPARFRLECQSWFVEVWPDRRVGA